MNIGEVSIPTDLQAIDSIRYTLLKYEEKNATTARKLKSIPSTTRDILDAMLPPRKLDGETQKVCVKQAVREDVINLQMALDDRLQLRQAREGGLCQVREELYSQTLDELVRQVTIECPERGLLLLRVRDEARMTVAAYQTLYESSVLFGVRKSLQAEIGTGNVNRKTHELEDKKRKLSTKLADLRNRYESIERRATERRLVIEKKRQEEIEFLKFQRQNLESFLKSSTTTSS